MFIIYIFLFSYLFFISNFNQLKILLFIILLGCIGSDIGLCLWKNFQRPKLAKISPNKTISGAIGSNFMRINHFMFDVSNFRPV